jgi:hypothetical protein
MRAKQMCALLVCGTSLWAGAARAICSESAASQADGDLWNIHGCWSDYILWHYKAYDTNSDDWGDRGFSDACNVNKEYPKHWNAAYLISYGLADDNNNSFHSGQQDYHPQPVAGGVRRRRLPSRVGSRERSHRRVCGCEYQSDEPVH